MSTTHTIHHLWVLIRSPYIVTSNNISKSVLVLWLPLPHAIPSKDVPNYFFDFLKWSSYEPTNLIPSSHHAIPAMPFLSGSGSQSHGGTLLS